MFLEDIIMRSRRVEFDTPGGRQTFDCSTMPLKFQANCRIHGYLTTIVEEPQRQPFLRDLARARGRRSCRLVQPEPA